MGTEVESIHRSRDVDVAVGIERAYEAPRMRFQITLNGKFWCERPIGRLRRWLAPKSLAPLVRGAISHHAQLACYAHAGRRDLLLRVGASVPVWVPQNGLALDRT